MLLASLMCHPTRSTEVEQMQHSQRMGGHDRENTLCELDSLPANVRKSVLSWGDRGLGSRKQAYFAA
jgi:hypothetical protein